MFRFFRRNREAVKKYLLIFFLSIVSIGMVITLAPIPTGDTSRMEMNALADIGGVVITTQDLQRTIQSRLRGSGLTYDSRMVPAVARAVLDDIILRQALRTQARKLRLAVTDRELADALRAIPWLHPGGTFIGLERYQDVIQQQTGMTVSQFEDQLRDSILLSKMRGVIADGVHVTPEEAREEFLRRNAKARIEYVLFDPANFLNAVAVAPQALEAFFKTDPQRYKVAEQRRVRYVLVDVDSVRSRAQLGEAELKQYYTQHLADYQVPDRVKVAHILLKTIGKSPEEVSTLEKTATEVLGKVRSGSDFSELAKKYSEDSTASNGGEIGWITRGQTVKEFEDAAFNIKPGQVSDLIKTTYGIHIVKLLDKQTAHLQTFEEVKGSIREALEKERLAQAQQSLAEEFRRQLEANPKAMDALAQKLGLTAKATDLFRYGQVVPDFGSSETFANLAFQLRPGDVGTPITVPKGLAVIQLAEVVPEHLPKLEEVRALVEQDYRAEQSKVVAEEKARKFAARCKAGEFRKVAQAAGYAVKESKEFTQQDNVEGVGSGSQLASAFTLQPGQTSDVVSVGGNHVVFRVEGHLPANEADFPAQRDQITEQLLQQKREIAFEIYRLNLKQQLVRSGELKLNEAAMKNFLASYERP